MSPFHTLLTKGVSTIIDRSSLEKKLSGSKKLRIKFGIDPTGTIVHLGHAVPILKLRQFQELGHQIILLIGDATAQVGDTSDKDKERPMLEREQTRKNAEGYLAKFAKILDIEKVEIYYNSQGLDAINFCGVGELAKHFSVAEMLDRDNFSKRYKAGQRISLQEFLYPLMQGYDSVALHSDVELGGNDQYFNLLAGRRLQEAFGQEKQDIMCFDLLLGPDGLKMSKTGGNCIPVDMVANEMFVKLMEVKDELIEQYWTLATLRNPEEVAEIVKRFKNWEHPKTIKLELATEIVTLYHGAETANQAHAYFEKVLTEGIMPSIDEMEKVVLPDESYEIAKLIQLSGLAKSSNEAREAVTSGGVRVDGNVIQDIKHPVVLSHAPTVVQMGKKKFRAIVRG